jgi:energy-coupling factor transport system permease protein
VTAIKLGQYVHGNSLLHQLDPRTKIIGCTIMVISVLLNYSRYYLLFWALLMAGAIILSGMKPRFVLGSLRSIRYLLLVTFLLQAFLTPGEPVWEWGIFKVTREGLQLGTINLLRLMILYLGSMVLLMTTSPVKLSACIEYLLLPLSKLKVPVENLAAILSISFRFIPTLVEEGVRIKKAQSSRGAQFEAVKIMVRLKSYLAILIPLFEASLARAEELGEAMDSRCYTSHPNKVRMSSLKLKRKDILLMGLLVVVWAWGIVLPAAGL